MEIGLHRSASSHAPTLAQPHPVAPTPSPTPTQEAANDPFYSTPLHTKTQSTLAPTAEFTRIFLLAWIIRYVFRGGAGTIFNKAEKAPGFRHRVIEAISKPGTLLKEKFFPSVTHGELEAASYAGAIGIGSGILSYRYSNLVRSDIQNIFSEAVAYENDKPLGSVTFDDIRQSDNAIVKRTVQNYREKFWSRIGTDTLFFIPMALRFAPLTDFLLGLKGVQIFADTWKRKTTMFEDLITFINNKINPRNGLGQAISVGEVFDLYQHYSEAFHPKKMFTNVVERGTGEGALWAQNEPIFQRMTELMNLTYAYKHSTKIDPNTGHALHQANFALPKFIYLLGHDLIDVSQPERTLATIEIANHFGIPAVKEMQTMLASGATLAQVAERFPTPTPVKSTDEHKPENGKKNAVIAKGSTMQVDAAPNAPTSRIDAATILNEHPLTQAQPQLA